MKQSISKRKPVGGMLGVAGISFFLLAMAILVGICFGSIFLFQGELQKFADDLALSGACQLNDGNRLGQMNELVGRCRQLVVASRQTAESPVGSTPELQTLSNQLLEEAEQNAAELEAERTRLRKLSLSESRAALDAVYRANKQHYNLSFPWIKLKVADVVSTTFGNVKGVDSNAKPSNGIPELLDYDQTKRYIDKDTGLYSGNIDAHIPQPDDQLKFKLASLAPPVRGQIAPARLMQDGGLQFQNDDQLPSAIRVNLQATLLTPGSKSSEISVLDVTSAAASTGASQTIR